MTEKPKETFLVRDTQGDSLTIDKRLLFCVQKSEKLATAIHRVTEYLSDTEPLRLELRKISLVILRDITQPLAEKNTTIGGLNDRIRGHYNEIIALCGVALASGQYSQMNFEIIRKEYTGLMEYVDNEALNEMRKMAGDFSSLIAPREEQPLLSKESSIPILYKGHYPSTTDLSYIMSHRIGEKDRIPMNFHRNINTVKNVKKEVILSRENGLKRQEAILTFLKKTGPSSIALIAKVVPGCAEKTVQRELNRLIGQAKVKRGGERRWSKYSIL